jgi:hypothetical protein
MICGTGGSAVDGIVDYAFGLGEAMTRLHGLRVDLVLRRPDGWTTHRLGQPAAPQRPIVGLAAALGECDAALLHYNPFSWARWGFAPWLAPALARARLGRPALPLGVVVHERYVPVGGLRATLVGLWQRAQFRAVLSTATVAFGSTDPWTARMRGETRAPVSRIPICSNIPDARMRRESMRAELGLTSSSLCVATFGNRHPTRLTGHIESAVRALADAGLAVTLLNLGSEPPTFPGAQRLVRVVAPGRLDAARLAEYMACADLYLAAFSDGVSTRRTTVMAALQHGLPIVGTDGHLTGPGMRGAADAITLTPASDEATFAAAAVALAHDSATRSRQGAAARRLYERDYDWPVACRVALAGLRADEGL